RCPRRTARARARHLPRRLASRNRVSRRARGGEPASAGGGVRGLAPLPGGGRDLPAPWLPAALTRPLAMPVFSPAELTAIALSLKVAAVAALASLPPGIAVAWLLARRRFAGKALLDALVHLPLVLPPVVVGYALLVVFGSQGTVGGFLEERFGIGVAFRWTGAALASAIMGFPLLVRAIRLSIESVDRRLEQAAATLGAGPWRVFATVTLPLAWPGIVAGAVLAFAK